MSDWTYISGSVTLEADPFKYKLNEDGTYKIATAAYQNKYSCRFIEYLPYPDEQVKFKLDEYATAHIDPYAYSDKKRNDFKNKRTDLCITRHYNAEISAMPIIRRTVKDHISELPSGEYGEFPYNITDVGSFFGSSQNYNSSKHLETIFQNYYSEYMQKSLGHENRLPWSWVSKHFPVELSNIDKSDSAAMTLHGSIRYCTADDMYNCLFTFFENLYKDGLDGFSGSIVFYDYGKRYIIMLDYSTFEVRCECMFDKDSKFYFEPYTEYWQFFGNWYDNKAGEYELRKVDKIIASGEAIKYNYNLDYKSKDNEE